MSAETTSSENFFDPARDPRFFAVEFDWINPIGDAQRIRGYALKTRKTFSISSILTTNRKQKELMGIPGRWSVILCFPDADDEQITISPDGRMSSIKPSPDGFTSGMWSDALINDSQALVEFSVSRTEQSILPTLFELLFNRSSSPHHAIVFELPHFSQQPTLISFEERMSTPRQIRRGQ